MLGQSWDRCGSVKTFKLRTGKLSLNGFLFFNHEVLIVRLATYSALPRAFPPRQGDAARPLYLHAVDNFLGYLLRHVGAVAVCLAVLAMSGPASANAPEVIRWNERLQAALVKVDAQHDARIGVYVRDLDTGQSVAYRADEMWYLASMVKVPAAMAVMRGIDRGDYTLDTTLTVRADDYVDGAGQTNHKPPGSAVPIRFLLEQMLIHSDNTASDMLIGLVGIHQVNALVESLIPTGFAPITTLADVRRHAYSHLSPAAMQLRGKDFFVLRQQRSDADRLKALTGLLGTPPPEFGVRSVAAAYAAYYDSGLNSGRLDAYGELLALLAEGATMGRESTAFLMRTLERVQTGAQRLKAGLPAGARYAHKTGTQRARTCDGGVITMPRLGRDRRVVVVACTQGELSLNKAEHALRDVGAAICRSGLLTGGTDHAVACPASLGTVPGAVPSLAPGLGAAVR